MIKSKQILTFLILGIITLSFSVDGSKKVPKANVQSLYGVTVNTSTFNNDGKPYVINFWATWCSPCKRELNNIAEVYDDWQEETGVKIIAISIDDARNAHKVKPYVDSKSWDFEIYIDQNQEFRRAMNVNNPPHTILVDGKGNIVYEHNGYVDGDEDELYEKIKELLK